MIDLLLNVAEQVFVEVLVAQAAIEAPNKPILHWFAWSDVAPLDFGLLLLSQDGVWGSSAVVADDRKGTAAKFGNAIQPRATRRPMVEVDDPGPDILR
jgi:hypothetical protein